MRLSSVYANMELWALVYHIQQDSEVVELITNRFFSSEKKAWKWFNRKYDNASFIRAQVVKVSGFGNLVLST